MSRLHLFAAQASRRYTREPIAIGLLTKAIGLQKVDHFLFALVIGVVDIPICLHDGAQICGAIGEGEIDILEAIAVIIICAKDPIDILNF